MEEMVFHEKKENTLYIYTKSKGKYPVFNEASLRKLTLAMKYGMAEPAISTIIFYGQNDSFSAGLDINCFKDMPAKNVMRIVAESAHLFNKFEKSDKISISAVSGYCLGGGMELVMATDYIIASEDARFGLPEIKIGLIPGADGIKRIVRAIGKRRAMDLLLTGRNITAKEALDIGLINEIIPRKNLLSRAEEIAKGIGSKNPLAVKSTKMLANKAACSDITRKELKAFHQCIKTDYAQNTIKSFLNKNNK